MSELRGEGLSVESLTKSIRICEKEIEEKERLTQGCRDIIWERKGMLEVYERATNDLTRMRDIFMGALNCLLREETELKLQNEVNATGTKEEERTT